jgi:phage tail-like protein
MQSDQTRTPDHSVESATATPLAGITLRVVPDTVEVALQPQPYGPYARHLASPFHRVEPRPSALVTLTSEDRRTRVVRLWARGRGPGWNPAWVRWIHAVRQAPPELLGGDALAAKDVLSADETTLTLLVLPGEKREATLEFTCVLDGRTAAGDYPFDVVATDIDGGETAAAGLLALRHPPATLLDRLPSLYREALRAEAGPGLGYQEPPFFERFLRGFEDAHLPIQQILDNLHELLSPDGAPADFLPWLATWVSLILDENWPELRRRRLIKEAVELFRWRGTRKGLKRYLYLYAGVTPEIADQPFTGMRLGPEARLGGPGTWLGHVPPHTFVVTLAVTDPGAINAQIVRDIIESEKPAHTAYELRLVRRATGE